MQEKTLNTEPGINDTVNSGVKVELGTLVTYPTFLLRNSESKLCESDPRSKIGSGVTQPVLSPGPSRGGGLDLGALRDLMLLPSHSAPF